MIRIPHRLGSPQCRARRAGASAYPGGTPSFQTDVAPFCAGCHSSRDAAALAGTGERATKETRRAASTSR